MYQIVSDKNNLLDIIVCQVVDDENNTYIGESLFNNNRISGRARLERVKEIKQLIASCKSKSLQHKRFINYQRVVTISEDYYLLRVEKDLIPLVSYINRITLDIYQIVEWMKVIIEVFEEAVEAELDWKGICPESLWVDSEGKLFIINPIVTDELIQYRKELEFFAYSTVFYPPEILDGQSWSEESYTYSIGVLFYYFITGHLPFVDNNRVDLKDKIKYAKFLEPKILAPEISLQLNELIIDLLKKDVKKRENGFVNLYDRINYLKENDQLLTRDNKEKAREEVEAILQKTKRRQKLIIYLQRYWKRAVMIVLLLGLFGAVLFTKGSPPIVTEATSAQQVVDYFYQGIDEKRVDMLEETANLDKLGNLESIIVDVFPVEQMRKVYEGNKDENKLFYLKDIKMRKINSSLDPVFEVTYTLVDNHLKKRVEFFMKDKIKLQKVDNKWKIVEFSGDLVERGIIPER